VRIGAGSLLFQCAFFTMYFVYDLHIINNNNKLGVLNSPITDVSPTPWVWSHFVIIGSCGAKKKTSVWVGYLDLKPTIQSVSP